MNAYFSTARWKAIFWTILFIICILLPLWWTADNWYEDRLLEKERFRYKAEIGLYGNALSNAINKRFALLEGLYAYTQANPTNAELDKTFNAFAAGLFAGSKGIRNFGLAPGGVQRYVYPLKENKQVAAHDLIHDKRPNVRADVQRTIKTKQIVLSGPYQLRQGGLGLVARKALFSGDSFWGLVTMVIDMPPVFEEAGIAITKPGLEIALLDKNKTVFYGNNQVLQNNPISVRIDLPDGQWELTGIPESGWKAVVQKELFFFKMLNVSIAILLASLAYLVINRQTQLQLSVIKRTSEISTIAEQLKETMHTLEKNYYVQKTIASVLAVSHETMPLKTQMDRILDIVIPLPWFGKESRGCIYTMNEESGELELQVHRGMPEAALESCARIDLGHCLCGRAAMERKVVFSNHIDERHDTRYQGITPHGHYCVPIITGDKLLGVINFYVEAGHPYSKDEDNFLVSISNALATVIERQNVEQDRISQLHFMEKLAQIDKVMLKAYDLEELIRDVQDALLTIFSCDRAWMLYPCDPDASSWQVPMERTRPEYPGALAMGIDMPMLPEVKEAFQTALKSNEPVTYDPDSGRALPSSSADQFSIQSQIIIAIRPKSGKPWLLGMHQCSHPRIWSNTEQALFKEIGRRITDSMGSMLFLRDLKASENKFSKAFHSGPTFMSISSMEGLLLEVNNTFLDMSGYSREELIGHTPLELGLWVRPADRAILINGLRENGTIHNQETSIRTKSGKILHVIYSADIIEMEGQQCVFLALLDITESKKLEEQLLHSQKMESIGTLAGGVAHDFNNILMAIMGFVGILNLKLPKNDPLKLYVDQIQKASEKAANLTSSLLAFSRKQKIHPVHRNLNEAITKMEALLFRIIGEDIELRTELADVDLIVMIDAGQMEQVLMNLATNARDSMPRGGLLTLTTDSINIDSEFKKLHGFGEAGAYALISISDTGMGMDNETREKVFEPFYTTKEVDKGTGLGLSIVYGIIKQHDGYITVYSERGQGTNFSIYLPLTKQSADKDTTEPVNSVPTGGTETILLAEDDAMIRELLTSVLEEYGYMVIAAEDGEDAMNKFMENRNDIQFLILDAIMPKKYGGELFEEIKKIRPDIKGVFLSGYTKEAIDRKNLIKEGMEFILKPIKPDALLKVIRDLLDKDI